jgi:hypothetical protein
MNQARVVIIFAVLLALSCSKDPVGNDNQTQSISGIVDGWQNGELLNKLDIGISDNSYFLKIDSATIKSGGNFSLNYPFPIPPDSVLGKYIPNRDSSQYIGNFDNILFSNSNVRYVPLYFCVYESHHQLRMTLFPSNRYLTSDSTSLVGDYFIQYYYFNQPTAISGSHRISFYFPPSSLYSKYNNFVTNFDLNISVGWNRIVTQIEQIHDSTVAYKVSTVVPGSPSWFPSWGNSSNFSHALYW